jgi:biotin carboxyl carrier protein
VKAMKFRIRGNVYDVKISRLDEDNARVTCNGQEYDVEFIEEVSEKKTPKLVRPEAVPTTEGKPKTHRPGEAPSVKAIRAPIPGTILEILVGVGDEVATGDTLLVMEAMKMENRIQAESAGRVSEILIETGQAVMENDVLLKIEP